MASGLKLIPLLCLTSGLWAAVVYGNHSGESCRTCPQGWIHFDKSCYLFQFTPMDWADAERHCTAIGGNLPSVHANDQYSFLRNTIHQLTGQHRGAWLGGYDAVKEGVWLWSDGSLFDFKHWAKGEPNDRSGKTNCMEMNFRGRDYINDTSCNQKRSFFCEKNL
ncbi:galactose-specific lectin nattectin-like [Labrus bergylta]|uniref:galactose-specific lectin nattectin-like n=1 Tax=Labrus bergylta TaxID=56723 RepID=UPI0033138331